MKKIQLHHNEILCLQKIYLYISRLYRTYSNLSSNYNAFPWRFCTKSAKFTLRYVKIRDEIHLLNTQNPTNDIRGLGNKIYNSLSKCVLNMFKGTIQTIEQALS